VLRGTAAGRFEYRSGETALLLLALQRALGPVSLTAYAQRRLWTPLGMVRLGESTGRLSREQWVVLFARVASHRWSGA
jgi:CubicO group peptidase (beta-lactamase class C family)